MQILIKLNLVLDRNLKGKFEFLSIDDLKNSFNNSF